MSQINVKLENGQVYTVKRQVNTVQDIINEIADSLKLTPNGRRYFGLCKRMSLNSPVEWLPVQKPLSPQALEAGRTLRLHFQLRYIPEKLQEFCKRDFEAAKYFYTQVSRQLMSNELTPMSVDVLTKLGCLQIIKVLIGEFHAAGKKCSSVKAVDALEFMDSQFGIEPYMPVAVLDAMKPSELRQKLRLIFPKIWPLREPDTVHQFLNMVLTNANLGTDSFHVHQLFSPRYGIHGLKGMVTIASGHGLAYSVHSSPQQGNMKIQFSDIVKVIVESGSTVHITTRLHPEPDRVRFSAANMADNFASLLDGYCVLEAGRSVVEFPEAAVKIDADFGKVGRTEAEQMLRKHGCTDGLYFVRISTNNPNEFGLEDYGISVCSNNEINHYKITRFKSLKYGIQDGLRFKTIGELIEHYYQDADGLCCPLTKNVMLLERPSEAQYAAAIVPGQKPRLDDSEYVYDTSRPAMPQDRPRASSSKGLADFEVPDSQVQLGDVLGEGEFGTVHRAIFTPAGRPPKEVAVKILKKAGPEQRTSFLQEAGLMVSLDHSNIVRMLGVSTKQTMMLLCELVPLGPLNKYLKANRSTLEVEQLLLFCVQVAEGMKYLESKRFVHRDLAARNILVETPRLVKITDFGLSRSLDNSNYYTAAQRGRWPIKWYAPESIFYSKFSHKSDVWSYGITVWEIMSKGKKPYSGFTGRQVVEVINDGGRLHKPSSCPPPLYDLMLKCWAEEAADRPSFSEIAVDIRRIHSKQAPPDDDQLPEDVYKSLQAEQVVFDMEKTPDEILAESAEDAATDSKLPMNLPDSAMTIPPSALRKLDKLGEGAFGSVMKGLFSDRSGRQHEVAIKYLKIGSSGYKELISEAEVMAKLQHPNLVKLFGVCLEGEVCMVTEFVALGPMNIYLRNNKANIGFNNLIQFLHQISSAMVYMEANRFVHRDLAARNVLVASPTSCKVADFGMSRAIGADSDYYRSAAKGRWPIKWYAPECLYHARFTSKSDVWSFGVTMWEILSFGEKPYKGLKGKQVLDLLDKGQRLPAPANTPKWAADMMRQCWQTDPSIRPNFAWINQIFADQDSA